MTGSKVDHPEYYQSSDGVECIDAIEAMGAGTGFCLGNALKYIWRAGKKEGSSAKEDVEKAVWYLNRFLWQIERDGNDD